MRIAGYIQESLQDGKGCNLVVFTQGCSIRCPHCQNPEAWDANGGIDAPIADVLSKVTDVTTGVTLSGGEPTDQCTSSLSLLRLAKKMGLRTTMYTGLTLKQWIEHPQRVEFEQVLDYIKIGPYIHELRCTHKGMTGSTNQVLYKYNKGVLTPLMEVM